MMISFTNRWGHGLWCTCLGLLLLLVVAEVHAGERSFVMVVANNHSLDEDVRPLRFADDDGAKYFEVFEAAGAEVTLLSVLDKDAQQRFPLAAGAAAPPTRANLDAALQRVFAEIESANAAGDQTDFYFIYTGHGNVGPNREGYINLADERFTRTDLYREILARSPAGFNHLVLDACHAYYFVNKRGGAPDKQGDYSDRVRSFLSEEELRAYPNTGVILAASSESETHEWSRLESGIFSHELISCLVGAGDVDGNTRVSYDEAAACVEAANHAILVPRARLKVHYNAPTQNEDQPLMRLDAFANSVRLRLPAEMANRYSIEDSRGVRTATFNYTAEQPMSLALVGHGPFFVRTAEVEAMIAAPGGEVFADQLVFDELDVASRGSVEQSFRRHLFETPFGLGFLMGMVSENSRPAEPPLPAVELPPVVAPVHEESSVPVVSDDDRGRGLRIWGWATLGIGVSAGLASGLTYYGASRSYDDYLAAPDRDGALVYKEATENRTLASQVLLGTSIAFVATGGALLIVDLLRDRSEVMESSAAARRPFLSVVDGGAILGLSGAF